MLLIFGLIGFGLQVDFNVILILFIDWVEIVVVGGVLIYGLDVVVGIINIIMKCKFSGLQFDGQYGIIECGDVFEYWI